MPDNGQRDSTAAEDAVRFLTALFAPEDLILFRPIETWVEGGNKRSRVDYDGVCYRRFGTRPADASGWEWFPTLLDRFHSQAVARAAAERTNTFFGCCPRLGPSGQYDQAWQVRTVRALWSDVDDCPPDTLPARIEAAGLPLPSILVASGNGCHVYWLLAEPWRIDDCEAPPPVHTEWIDQGPDNPRKRLLYLQDAAGAKVYLSSPQNVPPLPPKAQTIQDVLSGIAAKIGGDHTTDLSRILRLPGTLNRKDERNGRAPVPCRLVACDPALRYPAADFLPLAEISPARVQRDRVAHVPLPKKRKLSPSRQDRLDALVAACAAAEPGQRSEADFALCCYAVEHGQPAESVWQSAASVGKFAEAGRRYFDLTWATACQHTRQVIFDGAAGRQKEKRKAKAAASQPAAESQDEFPEDPHRLARINLERYASKHGGRTLRFWRDEWYVWKRNHYRKISREEFRSKLTWAIKQEFDAIYRQELAAYEADSKPGQERPRVRKVTMPILSTTVQATASIVCLSGEVEPNTWLPDRTRRRYLSLENGLLDLDALLAGHPDHLLPNSPDWFSMVSLPYRFDPEAACPRWEAFLERNLEMDPERIKVVQEWAGYLLLDDSGEQKFMVLEGEGANGKSVYCTALTAMLGEANVSNIPLEVFGDRFARTETLGKTLNTSGDCGELDKVAEGYLKSFTGGDRMFFDRKGVPGVNCRPTARLMLACNNRPRFSDHSEGVWRRMLVIPWRIEIPVAERVRGMTRIDWWQESGELPGILNWAILGLARLRAQGGFTRSEVMEEALADYREEMNPARVFLTANLEPCDTGRIRSSVLYKIYTAWVKENGYKPLAERNFGKEIRRCFKKVKRKYGGDRSGRYWLYEGLAFTSDEICGQSTYDALLF